MYKICRNLDEAFDQFKKIVSIYESKEKEGIINEYNETQVRTDFINPFIKSLGWDLENIYDKKKYSKRDVIEEPQLELKKEANEKKNPDYKVRVYGKTRYFIEAKKFKIDLEKDKKSCYQVKRYGWNASLNISVLTNFKQIAIYDCRQQMFKNENPSLNRFKFYNYKDLLKRDEFEELYKILSYENNYNQEYLLENFNSSTTKSELFKDHFLNNIREFRKKIAQNIMDNNDFNIESISYLTERLVDKIVFSKVSFDRGLQEFQSFNTIKTFKEFNIFMEEVYKNCPIEILKADKKNTITDEIIKELLNELAYENSPYDFSMVEASVLGEIYEQYLCEKLEIKNKKINVILKEEVKSNGIVYTPSNIANKIIELTLRDDFILNKEQKVLDICCGSGTFLIEVYKWICDEYLDDYYLNNNHEGIEMTKEKKLKLTFEEKIKIFKLHIFGVDISHDSLEVTKLNIYLKMLELEERIPTKILKDLNISSNIKSGNSLVDHNIFEINSEIKEEDVFKIKPFNWKENFKEIMKLGGFDFIVGNPPYVRIQKITKYLPAQEKEYYENKNYGYTTTQNNKAYDKYYLFIERALELLKNDGKLGYIVPNKFTILESGRKIRDLILRNRLEIYIDFGTLQLFKDKTTYTSILKIRKSNFDYKFLYEKVNNFNEWLNGKNCLKEQCVKDLLNNKWVFTSEKEKTLINKIKKVKSKRLDEVAEIFVGLQTSENSIYIIKDKDILKETNECIRFETSKGEFEVEKELIKPYLENRGTLNFMPVEANSKIIFPYIDGQLIDLSNFPKVNKYFNSYKSKLLKRTFEHTEVDWYKYGRIQSLKKFDGSIKMIWTVLGLKPRYTIDFSNIFVTGGGNGPYYCLRPKNEYEDDYLYYLLAILSHPLIDMMVIRGSSSFKGDFYSRGKTFIKDIPIKTIATISEKKCYTNIIEATKELLSLGVKIEKEAIPEKEKFYRDKFSVIESNIFKNVDELYNLIE